MLYLFLFENAMKASHLHGVFHLNLYWFYPFSFIDSVPHSSSPLLAMTFLKYSKESFLLLARVPVPSLWRST